MTDRLNTHSRAPHTSHANTGGTSSFRWAYRLVAALIVLFGLYYLILGGYLATLSGSPYFAVAGVAMLVAGGCCGADVLPGPGFMPSRL